MLHKNQPKVQDLKQPPFMVPHESLGQLKGLAIPGWGGCSHVSGQLVDQLGAGWSRMALASLDVFSWQEQSTRGG